MAIILKFPAWQCKMSIQGEAGRWVVHSLNRLTLPAGSVGLSISSDAGFPWNCSIIF